MRLTSTLHAACAAFAVAASTHAAPQPAASPPGDYAVVNGLRMYYEVHGDADSDSVPLVLLHGGLSTIDATFAQVLPALAESRRVIAVEQQGHGHTADRDAPFSYEQMADDTAALLDHLDIERADFFGWSDGGIVALQIAIRHPQRVRKLALLGASIDNDDALGPEILAWLKTATPNDFGPQAKAAYAAAAPDPDRYPALIDKLKTFWLEFEPIPEETVASIRAPALVMAGDRGGDRPEHAVRIFRVLPDAQLAILPGATHFALMERPDWILPMLEAFLDAPMPDLDAPAHPH